MMHSLRDIFGSVPARRSRPPQRLAILLLLSAWALIASQSVLAASTSISIASGSGRFSFEDRKGDPSKHITVYTYVPRDVKPDKAPIVFVMHGHGDNAKGYRDTWIEYADKYGFIVVAPLFDPKQWPDGGYSYASVVGKDGKRPGASMWSFSVIEHLFDAIKDATGNQSPRYFIYGHSEGGQFVHRLVLLLPDARYAIAVAANPGWYTMPNFDTGFPYGLGGSAVDNESLKRSLGRRFILMLGDRDTDPNHKELRKTPQAMAQGATRFERGQKFFKDAGERAIELKCAFGWQVRVVQGAAHENRKMSGPAAAALMGH
jgi:poly(3-hydroxybutyrate) depolymerase